MIAKAIATTPVPKREATGFARKAEEFFGVMNVCVEDGEWNSVVLMGVHACISMCDAICVYKKGERSKSSNHHDAIHLLEQALPAHDDVGRNIRRLQEVISKKHAVEYDPRNFSEKEARVFAEKIGRFFDWARTHLVA